MKKCIYLIAVIVAILFYSCKPVEKLVYVDVPRTIIKIDSIYVNSTDSFIEKQKGDTILQYRWKTYYKEKIKINVDTVTVVKEVEIPVEVKVDKIIMKKGFIYYSGLFMWLIAIGFIGFKVYNFFRPKL
jgi:hypothetical protein